MGGPVVDGVVGDDERSPVDADLAEVAHVVAAVVPLRQHGQHGLGGRQLGTGEAPGEERGDPLGDAHQRVDVLVALRPLGQLGDAGDLVADAPEHALPLGVHQRLVEPPEPHAARQVADDGDAQLGGAHEVVQGGAGTGVVRRLRRGVGEPAAQQRGHDLQVGGRALLRDEDPEDRLLELVVVLQVGDAVATQHGPQPLLEVLRQGGANGVEALEVGVEVLAGAVDAVLEVEVVARGAVAGQLREVGEGLEQLHLRGDGALPTALPRARLLVADREV